MKRIAYYIVVEVPDDESEGSIQGIEKMLTEAVDRKGYNLYDSDYYQID